VKIKLTLDTSVDDVGNITQQIIGEHQREFTKWIIHTREEAVRAALISLGWTPPNETR